MAKSRRATRRDRKSGGATTSTPRRAGAASAPARTNSALRTALLWGLPAVAGALGLLLYFVWNSPRAAGITLVGGAVAWLTFALSDIGSRVKPQDRTRAGAIDFGTRR